MQTNFLQRTFLHFPSSISNLARRLLVDPPFQLESHRHTQDTLFVLLEIGILTRHNSGMNRDDSQINAYRFDVLDNECTQLPRTSGIISQGNHAVTVIQLDRGSDTKYHKVWTPLDLRRCSFVCAIVFQSTISSTLITCTSSAQMWLTGNTPSMGFLTPTILMVSLVTSSFIWGYCQRVLSSWLSLYSALM